LQIAQTYVVAYDFIELFDMRHLVAQWPNALRQGCIAGGDSAFIAASITVVKAETKADLAPVTSKPTQVLTLRE